MNRSQEARVIYNEVMDDLKKKTITFPQAQKLIETRLTEVMTRGDYNNFDRFIDSITTPVDFVGNVPNMPERLRAHTEMIVRKRMASRSNVTINKHNHLHIHKEKSRDDKDEVSFVDMTEQELLDYIES